MDALETTSKYREMATLQFFEWVKTIFMTSSGMVAGLSIFLLGPSGLDPEEPILLWSLFFLILSTVSSLWGLRYKHTTLFQLSQQSASLAVSGQKRREIIETSVPLHGKMLCTGSGVLYSIAILLILYRLVPKLLC